MAHEPEQHQATSLPDENGKNIKNEKDIKKDTFPVVGIGTSAGGVQALQTFFKAMPPDSGIAFVVIQHLHAEEKSHLPEILARCTQMSVKQVTEKMPLQPDCVYVIPPGQVLEIHGSMLELSDLPESRLLRKPIDAFFRSLGQACGERAVAIIMSGTGGNGSMGVREVKNQGGIVLVQDPAEAQYDSMPRHALATGIVDRTLRIEQMPAVIQGYANHPYVREGEPSETDQEPWAALTKVLALLRTRTGREFRCYKKNTLLRRTLRRMGLRHITQFEQYMEVLQQDSDEVAALAEDLLIGVTSFFRDREAWTLLQEQVLPKLMADRSPDLPVRAWTPGCSSGEEAYSLAILLHEQARKSQFRGEIKVFASDAAGDRLLQAREGRFPDSIEADVPQDLLDRYFEKQNESYRIRPKVRESVVFAPHDLISHPPFSQLDLITCRNLLIYLEPETQAKVLALFHFALRPGGYLFLGSAETVTQQQSLFETISKKWRIYQRVGPTRHDLVSFPLYNSTIAHSALDRLGHRPPTTPKPRLDEMIHRHLAHTFGPPAVLITQDLEALYFHGSTDRFLAMPSGVRTGHLLEMAREGLRYKLRNVITEAFRENHRVVSDAVRVRRDDGWVQARITATPLVGSPEHGPLALVIFEDASDAAKTEAPKLRTPIPPGTESELVHQLEEELRNTRSELRSTIAELEISSEEQKAANEEISSTNEELQSTNEELETSREELQSLNEELTTVNQQLHTKVQELESANNDLSNLLSSTDVATVFLDVEFRLRWFAPAAQNLLPVIASDVGRPIANFSRRFRDPNLFEDSQDVLRKLAPISREVHTEDGRWYLRRALPYRTHDHHIEGVVITFNDITELKQAQERERRLATVMRDFNDAVILLDFQGDILEWNRGAAGMYGWSPAEAVRKNIRDLVPAEGQPAIDSLLASLAQGQEVRSAEAERVAKDGRRFPVWLTLSLLRDDHNNPVAAAMTERDLTELKAAQAQLEAFNEELERRVAERTELAEQRAEQLRQLSLDLSRAEQNERRRIAQVLHDDLQQVLAAARMAVGRVQRDGAENVIQGLEHLSQLLEQALDITRNLSHEISPPILQEGLVPALDWVRRWCGEKHKMHITIKADPAAEPASSDLRYLLFAASRELLFNVAKHSGTDRAEIELTRTTEGIRLVVKDEGRGFRPDDLQTADKTEAGFGLLNMRERVASLGGEVDIQSHPNDGAQVTIVVPDTKAPISAEPASSSTAESPAAQAPQSNSPAKGAIIRILLVDDHQVMRNGLASLLKNEPGIEVVAEADCGEMAIDMVVRHLPDVVLMDVSMPGIGGVEATRRITARLPHVAVVGLSMHDPADRANAMIEAGAAIYVQKSAPADELVDAVRSVVRNQRS